MSGRDQGPGPDARPKQALYDLSQDRRPSTKRGRLLGASASVGFHLVIVLALLGAHAEPPKMSDPPSVTVALINGLTPVPVETPPAPPHTAPPQPVAAKPLPHKNKVRRTPAPRDADTLPADDRPTTESGVQLSEAQLAGAATADSGTPGGACNMARLLQGKLRKDPLVQAAVARSAGKAIIVWNGDWIRSHDEDGNGLAALRESMIWEIGFAPEACRAKPVYGLVLLSMNDAPGAPRVAVGGGVWRWSDLLHSRPAQGGLER